MNWVNDTLWHQKFDGHRVAAQTANGARPDATTRILTMVTCHGQCVAVDASTTERIRKRDMQCFRRGGAFRAAGTTIINNCDRERTRTLKPAAEFINFDYRVEQTNGWACRCRQGFCNRIASAIDAKRPDRCGWVEYQRNGNNTKQCYAAQPLAGICHPGQDNGLTRGYRTFRDVREGG